MIFSGHIAVVTGGRGALGEALVRGFLDEGARVAVPVHPATPARSSSHEGHAGSPLRLTQPNLFEGPCDVTSEEDVHAFCSATREACGDPDILVHAAGAYAGASVLIGTSAWAVDACLSVDVDQVGASTPGADLVVTVVYE